MYACTKVSPSRPCRACTGHGCNIAVVMSPLGMYRLHGANSIVVTRTPLDHKTAIAKDRKQLSCQVFAIISQRSSIASLWDLDDDEGSESKGTFVKSRGEAHELFNLTDAW